MLPVLRRAAGREEAGLLGEVEGRQQGEDHGQDKKRKYKWAATPHDRSPDGCSRAPVANTLLSSTIGSRPSVDEDEARSPESRTVIREGVQTSESKVAKQEGKSCRLLMTKAGDQPRSHGDPRA